MPAERAIEHKSQDTLGRDQFVQRLTHALISAQTKRATAIAVGLTGTWGSGKSSILNLVAEHIATAWPTAIVVRFNPWLVSGRNDLIREYFGELRSLIATSRYRLNAEAKKLLKTLVDYGDRISPMLDCVPGGIATKAVIKVGAASLNRSESLTALRAELLKGLSSFSNPIVVMIDEVDRVDSSDVLSIAQLVRSIADFPNVSYLLAYDSLRVAHALGNGDEGRGRDYLEKIVQLQIPIPAITADELAAVLRGELTRISEFSLPAEFWTIERYREIESIIAARILSTLRDVKRLVETFRTVFSMVQGDADWIDVLGYCVLLTKAPDVVNRLKENMESVVEDPLSEVELLRRATAREKRTDTLLDEMLGTWGSDSGIASLLKKLFSRFGSSRSEHSHVDSIGRRRTFLVVLRLGILPGGWSRQDLLQFSNQLPEKISANLHSLKEQNKLGDFIDRLSSIYGDLQSFDHLSFWLGVAGFSTRKPPSWATHYTGIVYDMRELSDALMMWCGRTPEIAKVTREIYQRLKSHGNISLTSRWLHHHAFAYGLFGRELRSGYGTFLSVSETEQETHEHCKLWMELHRHGELLPSGWDLVPVYVMNAGGYWTDEMRKLLAHEIGKSEAAVRGGPGNLDTGISGFLPGHDRREVHAKAET